MFSIHLSNVKKTLWLNLCTIDQHHVTYDLLVYIFLLLKVRHCKELFVLRHLQLQICYRYALAHNKNIKDMHRSIFVNCDGRHVECCRHCRRCARDREMSETRHWMLNIEL